MKKFLGCLMLVAGVTWAAGTSFDTAKIEANKIILEDIRLKLITNEK